MSIKAFLDLLSIWMIPAIIIIVLTLAMYKKLPIYSLFTDGAKDGIKISLNIFPYMLAMMVAIYMLRASGAIEAIGGLCGGFLAQVNVPVDAIPIMIVRSLSGGAVLGILGDIVAHNDINSYLVRLSAIMVGSSETTFYVLAVYFGAVGIKKFRYALLTGILADIIGIIAAVVVAQMFFCKI